MAFATAYSNYSGPFVSSGNYASDMSKLRNLSTETYVGANGLTGSTTNAIQARAQMADMQQKREIDPWSFYRGGAADLLAQQGANDPSNFYRDKLKQMSMGEFGPDDPSYQFRFDEGQRMLERSLGARGLLNSGNAAVELQQRGQDLASAEYGAQFDRMLKAMGGVSDQYNTSMNRLMALAGVGNAGVGLHKEEVDQGIADNANFQRGIARSFNTAGNGGGIYGGYSFG